MLKDDELIHKYIKYSSKITEEIFDKIVRRLEKAKFTSVGIECDFAGFKKHGYLMFRNTLHYQTSSIINEPTEIFYKDIIGEEFLLKVGDKVKVIQDRIGRNYSGNWIHSNSEEFGHYKGGNSVITIKEIGKHYNESRLTLVYGTYGDNKECCFNIDALELVEEDIPEYVECIKAIEAFPNTSVIGRVYKVEDEAGYNASDWVISFDGEKFPSVDKKRFKPSTKEAYDAQFKEKSLKVGDLVEGEYYCTFYSHDKDNVHIFKVKSGNIDKCDCYCIKCNYEYTNSFRYFTKNSKYESNLRFATPEEKEWLNVCIQENKFIPKEDVDKYLKPKFEIGKWYKFTAAYLEMELFAKYSNRQDVSGRFYHDEMIKKGFYSKKHDWSVMDVCPVLLTDLSEIQSYLPEGHPDKIIMKEEELKKGDEVIVLSDKSYHWGKSNGQEKLVVGKTYAIHEIREEDYITLKTERGWIALKKENVKKVSKEEEFKMGDWITIEDNKKLQAGCQGCPIGTFQIINKKSNQGLFDSDKGFNINDDNNIWRISSEGVRKATSEEIQKVKGEFVLPEKWCIRIEEDNYKMIGEWFDKHIKPTLTYSGSYIDRCWIKDYLHYPKCFSNSCTNHRPIEGYTEITFDQFRKYGLKEESNQPFKVGDWVYAERGNPNDDYRKEKYVPAFQIAEIDRQIQLWLRPEKGRSGGIISTLCKKISPVESITPEEAKMQELLNEAKKRFPIGCTFRPVRDDGIISDSEYTQKRECYIYDDNWIIGSANIRNAVGDWAKLVSSPEEKDLITIAKERYPIGTNVKSLYNGEQYTGIITGHKETDNTQTQIWFQADKFNLLVYDKGKWATIVSTPKQEVINKFPPISHSKFGIGDRVEIKDSGYQYRWYDVAFKAMNFKDTKSNICSIGDIGTIFSINKNEETGIVLISINLDNGKQCLIGVDGIEMVSEKKTIYNPDEWGWEVVSGSGFTIVPEKEWIISNLEDLKEMVEASESISKPNVISPILFDVKKI